MSDDLRRALRRAAGPQAPGVDMDDVRRRSRAHDGRRRAVTLLVALVVPLAVAGALGRLAADPGGGLRFDQAPAAAPVPAANPPGASPSPSPSPTPTDAERADRALAFRALAPGLFCRDLAAQGFGYPQAVAYWLREGVPERMDADLNGVPCETVYPEVEVQAFLLDGGVGPGGSR